DGGGILSSIFGVALNNSGQVAFGAATASGQGGIFRGDGSTLTLIVRTDQSAPDGNGLFRNFGGVNASSFNDAGQVAFQGSLYDTMNSIDPSLANDRLGIFRGDGTELTQIARSGMAAPGGDGVLADLSDTAQINAAGQ